MPENTDGSSFQVYQCSRQECGLRFTILVGASQPWQIRSGLCPTCQAPLQPIGEAYSRLAVEIPQRQTSAPEVEVMLDNIRSAWNVGAMLRSSDGAGVRKVHLCGVSSSPENPKVAKTALGAEKSLPWSLWPNGVEAAKLLLDQGMRLWALEGGPRAVSLFDLSREFSGSPIVLVAGNELSGVDPGILDLCERVVCLPMQGIKGSLNVAVAFGIAVYTLRFGGSRGCA